MSRRRATREPGHLHAPRCKLLQCVPATAVRTRDDDDNDNNDGDDDNDVKVTAPRKHESVKNVGNAEGV